MPRIVSIAATHLRLGDESTTAVLAARFLTQNALPSYLANCSVKRATLKCASPVKPSFTATMMTPPTTQMMETRHQFMILATLPGTLMTRMLSLQKATIPRSVLRPSAYPCREKLAVTRSDDRMLSKLVLRRWLGQAHPAHYDH